MFRFKTTISAVTLALAVALDIPITAHSEIFIPDSGADLYRYCSASVGSELMNVCRIFLGTVWNAALVINGTPAIASRPFFCPGPKPAFAVDKIVGIFRDAARDNPNLLTAPPENAAIAAFIIAFPCR